MAYPAELTERLEKADLKASANRIAVLEALAKEPNDATAQEIHRRLAGSDRKIGLATVYRALSSMSEAGVIDRLPHEAGESCYRLCSPTHHHHLVCESCHRVVELKGCPAGAWAERAATEHAFEITSHRLEVSGLCAECRG